MRLSGVAGCAAAESADMRLYLISYTFSAPRSLVTGFYRQGPALVCDGVALDPIAAAEGTPLYVYSAATIAGRYRAIDEAFAGYPHAIHYALKANSTLAITRLLRGLGSSADANSGGEIDVALRAGFIPAQVVFTGVGKTTDELAHAIDLGVRIINVESAGELERVDALSRERQVRTKIAIRINPDVDAKTHPHISTGPQDQQVRHRHRRRQGAVRPRARPGRRRGRRPARPHRLADHRPRAAGARRRARWSRWRASSPPQGTRIEHLDLGGGLGVSYDGSRGADRAGVRRRRAAHRARVRPGDRPRAGTADRRPRRRAPHSRRRREGGRRREAVRRDGRGDDRVDPADALQRLPPHRAGRRHDGAAPTLCDVVGPLCESSDTLGKDRTLPRPQVGELYAVLDTGAYGSVMASNYNRRLLPAEVLVEDGAARLIRRRQTLDDVLALEI